MKYVRVVVLAALLMAVTYFIYSRSAIDPFAVLAYNERNFSDLETFPQLAQNSDGSWRADYYTPGGVLRRSTRVQPLVHFTIDENDEWTVGEDERLVYSVEGRDVLVNGKKFHTVTNPRFKPFVDEDNVIRFREDHPCDREEKFSQRGPRSGIALVSLTQLEEHKNFYRSGWKDFPESTARVERRVELPSRDRVAVTADDEDTRAISSRRPLYRDDLLRYGYGTGEVYDDSGAKTAVKFFESRNGSPHPKSYWNCVTRHIETCPEGEFDPETGKCFTVRNLIRYVDPDEFGSISERRRLFASAGSELAVKITIDVELAPDVTIRAKVSLGAAREFKKAAEAKSGDRLADVLDSDFCVRLSDIGTDAFSAAVRLPAAVVWRAQRLSNDVTFRLVEHGDVYSAGVEVLVVPVGRVLVDPGPYPISAEWFDPSRAPFVNCFAETETHFGCFLYEKLVEMDADAQTPFVSEMFCEGHFGLVVGLAYQSSSGLVCLSGRRSEEIDTTPIASPLIVDTLLRRRDVAFEYRRNPAARAGDGTFAFRDGISAERAYRSFSCESDLLERRVDLNDPLLDEAAFSTGALWARKKTEYRSSKI